MEPEGSLPHSQLSATCPYPAPARSSTYSHFLKIHLHVPFSLLRSYQSINPSPRQVFMFRNKPSFYGEQLLTPRPTPKLEDHPLSAVRNSLFNIFTFTLHIGDRCSIHNLRAPCRGDRDSLITDFICYTIEKPASLLAKFAHVSVRLLSFLGFTL